MPKEGKLDNYMRISQQTISCLLFAVLNIFSQIKAASLTICNSLSTTDFYGYINTGYVFKCYFGEINKKKKNPMESFSDNDTIHGGD